MKEEIPDSHKALMFQAAINGHLDTRAKQEAGLVVITGWTRHRVKAALSNAVAQGLIIETKP